MKMRIKHMLIFFYSVFLLFALPGSFTGCGSKSEVGPPPVDTTTTPVTPPPGPTSHPPVLGFGNGVDLQPSYYNGGNVNFGWSLMQANTHIKTVRIEIEPTVSIALATSWIQQARTNGFAVIATYHKYTVLGSDDAAELTAAANWWRTNYSSLAAAGSFTVNLMNEWGDHNLTVSAYASAYNNAISIVRQVYSGIIIIDCSGWGQETAVAAAAILGTNGVTKIADTNIVPSVHVYPNGYNQLKGHTLQSADLDDLAAAGRGGIVGEFGNSPSGAADWSGIVTYAKGKGWPVLAWSWNGDGGTMNMVTPPWVSSATATTFTTSSYFSTVYSLL
jgi:mannan endo-1,4-beta-mannosidase